MKSPIPTSRPGTAERKSSSAIWRLGAGAKTLGGLKRIFSRSAPSFESRIGGAQPPNPIEKDGEHRHYAEKVVRLGRGRTAFDSIRSITWLEFFTLSCSRTRLLALPVQNPEADCKNQR